MKSVSWFFELALTHFVVANFAVYLRDANVMIQVSGAFGSRQEERSDGEADIAAQGAHVSFLYIGVEGDCGAEFREQSAVVFS